jgi:hypothetical protein
MHPCFFPPGAFHVLTRTCMERLSKVMTCAYTWQGAFLSVCACSRLTVTTYLYKDRPLGKTMTQLRKDVQIGNIETREYCRRACPEGNSSCELSHTSKIASTEVICISYGLPKKIWMDKSLKTGHNA